MTPVEAPPGPAREPLNEDDLYEALRGYGAAGRRGRFAGAVRLGPGH